MTPLDRAQRFFAAALLALVFAMIWTPAHASFPATPTTTYRVTGPYGTFDNTSIIASCTAYFNAAGVAKSTGDFL